MANARLNVDIAFEPDRLVKGAYWFRYSIKGRPYWKWRKWIAPMETVK